MSDEGSVCSQSTTRKRPRHTLTNENTGIEIHSEQSLELSRGDAAAPKRRYSSDASGTIAIHDGEIGIQQSATSDNTRSPRGKVASLTGKQQNFIRHWYDTFMRSDEKAVQSRESTRALATLIQSRPQLVFEYVKRIYPSSINTDDTLGVHCFDKPSFSSQSKISDKLSTANPHLHPSTRLQIEKYIAACRRQRPRTDGRRSVNTGPYSCTFGCGYRTRRVFDWRRHEETHEPQELWLCNVCSHENAFMVSRKDKFLRHARECHKNSTPDKILEESRLDWTPNEILKCPKCEDGCENWDARCRHVLAHFEDEELERKQDKTVTDDTRVDENMGVEGSISGNSNDGSER